MNRQKAMKGMHGMMKRLIDEVADSKEETFRLRAKLEHEKNSRKKALEDAKEELRQEQVSRAVDFITRMELVA